jgi:LmbE family N-acetylglucosaminyl deacetylase
VALVTNGDGARVETAAGQCNAPGPEEQRAAGYGLMRGAETQAGMQALGLTWTPNLATTEVIFLGYPGMRISDIAVSDTPMTTDLTGLHRTYANDFDGNEATCDGDFRQLLSGTHSQLTAAALAADLDDLLELTAPTDVYTHASFDGHPDHAEIYRQMAAAMRRTDTSARVHTTIMHPQGDTFCMGLSSARWPNPPLLNNDPFARFTPTIDFTAPPANPCDANDPTTSWGPFGPPNELVEVPAAMQATSETDNLKWQAIDKYSSQIDCTNPDEYHVNCGYMRGFVKKREFFWKYEHGQKRIWPQDYTAEWTSNESIPHNAQILEGEWRYENGGVRPVSTGFDRALLIGDRGWTDYEVTLPMTIHSFDASSSDAGIGIGLGWQGHTAWGQPRVGHPTGGLCLYGRARPEPTPYRLTIGYSPGPTDDTTMAAGEMTLAPGVQYYMRFRQQGAGAGAGLTRYSCKVWRADQAEPAQWTLSADIPDWPGTTGQRSGSSVLLAHEGDATFGDVTVSPVGD